MDPITSRNRSRSVEPDVYWRRRLFALVAGLAVFGLLAWAVGGAGGSRPTAATTSLDRRPPQVKVTPVIASPAPSATAASPSPSPTATPRHQARHARKGAAGQRAARRGKAHAARAAAVIRGSGCPAADVVLTMTASGNSYGARARPGFSVDVVSTDSRTCTFNTGSGHLILVIESGGVRVWGSADCAGKRGASVTTKLKRGVPVQLRFSWGRLLSAPGCRGARTPARPGTYTATASEGRLRSRPLTFVLR
jgi:hypothetical protein